MNKEIGLIKIDENHALIRFGDGRVAGLIRVANPARTYPADGESLKKRLKYFKPSSGGGEV